MFKSFRDVLDLWPSREALAAELGADSRKVSKWWQRDSIPPAWWLPIVSTKVAKTKGLSLERLAALAAREPAEARA